MTAGTIFTSKSLSLSPVHTLSFTCVHMLPLADKNEQVPAISPQMKAVAKIANACMRLCP